MPKEEKTEKEEPEEPFVVVVGKFEAGLDRFFKERIRSLLKQGDVVTVEDDIVNISNIHKGFKIRLRQLRDLLEIMEGEHVEEEVVG